MNRNASLSRDKEGLFALPLPKLTLRASRPESSGASSIVSRRITRDSSRRAALLPPDVFGTFTKTHSISRPRAEGRLSRVLAAPPRGASPAPSPSHPSLRSTPSRRRAEARTRTSTRRTPPRVSSNPTYPTFASLFSGLRAGGFSGPRDSLRSTEEPFFFASRDSNSSASADRRLEGNEATPRDSANDVVQPARLNILDIPGREEEEEERSSRSRAPAYRARARSRARPREGSPWRRRPRARPCRSPSAARGSRGTRLARHATWARASFGAACVPAVPPPEPPPNRLSRNRSILARVTTWRHAQRQIELAAAEAWQT